MEPPPPTIPITEIYFSSFKAPLALHRRANRYHIVLPRAYGMSSGYKNWLCLNNPGPNDASPDPPVSHAHLNPRIWLRSGRDWVYKDSNYGLTLEVLMSAEPRVFKDSGLRRTAKDVIHKHGNEVEIEEWLVEVLLKEEELCQRCAWCGRWELSYVGEPRFGKAGEGKNGRPMYWCGVSGETLIFGGNCYTDCDRNVRRRRIRFRGIGGGIRTSWIN